MPEASELYQGSGFYNLGASCECIGRPQEAEHCFRTTIEAMPGSHLRSRSR